ncbi:MAG: hypothetical protein ACQEP3_01855 [Patescibacteria group bacterium]
MEFEPTFSPEKKLSDQEKEKRAIEELREGGEKSKELKALIDKKWKRHEKYLVGEGESASEVEDDELTLEELKEEMEKEKEEVYNRYLKDLELSEEDLEGKSILDLGCGKMAPFIQKLMEKDLEVELKGVDIDLDEDHLPEELEGVVEYANFEKEIPGGDYDYIFAYGSIFAYEWRDPESAILNAVEKLNAGGEMKIMPISEPVEGDIKPMEKQWNKMKSILEKAAEENNLTLEIKGVDFIISGNDEKNKDIWIRNLATLKKN